MCIEVRRLSFRHTASRASAREDGVEHRSEHGSSRTIAEYGASARLVEFNTKLSGLIRVSARRPSVGGR